MSRAFLVIILLLVCCAASGIGYALTPLDAEIMYARVTISNTLVLENTGPEYRVDEATGALSWYPRDNWLQRVTILNTRPTAQQTPDAIIFQWNKPSSDERITVDSMIETRNAIVPVRDMIAFPLQGIPQEMEQYLTPGEITDSTPEIQALAQQLAAGKTDAYEVIYTLADWTTTNVNYSLASLGQPASQRSSQVLKSRYGKCDELTALFISMNRALGIPARFAAGYAYTNSPLFNTTWGGHGWAEVWLPGQGWVPFDVTYGEYGYLDAGHVTLKTAPDAKETSVDYSAEGRDFRMVTRPLDITVTPLRLTEQDSPPISISLESPHKTVGFGSAVLILATVKNNRDYYVSTRLDLAKTTNTNELSGTYNNILLKPHETRTVPFLVLIDEHLQYGYEYEFPFKLHTRLGPESAIVISVRQDAPVYDQSSYAEEIARNTQQAPRGSRLIVTCEKGTAYVGNPVTHTCAVTGAGTAASLTLCSEEKCWKAPVQESAFSMVTSEEKAGVYTQSYIARQDSDSTRFFVTSRSVDHTSIVASIDSPDIVSPNDIITATLSVNHTGALPEDVNISMEVHHARSTQHVDALNRPALLRFVIPARVLRPGENTITARITYTDELGTASSHDVHKNVTLTGVSMLDRISFALEDASYWVQGLFS